jgi:HEAT repeat protein
MNPGRDKEEGTMAQHDAPRSEQNAGRKKDREAETIESLIASLASSDGMTRVRARRSLVARGTDAVAPLVQALASRKQWVRWEAAKSLGQIGNPAAAQALVCALEDKMFDVRWLAAEGLIVIGSEALGPLLRTLIEDSDSVWLREGAHHVLHDLAHGSLRTALLPVVEALENVDAVVVTPLAAETALDVLARVDAG